MAADQSTEVGIEAQRVRIAELKRKLAGIDSPLSTDLLSVAETLVRKSIWLVGGDGWAYDIGAGGLDHVLGSGHNVKVLVLDTEVRSEERRVGKECRARGAAYHEKKREER